MARFILGEEPVEVFATRSCRVDPMFADLGDIDSAMIVMRTANGTLCHINNTRRASYGYDQRVEGFGAKGMIRSENLRHAEVTRHAAEGTEQRPPLLHFFIERYRDSYEIEIGAFVEAIRSGGPTPVTFDDGRRALLPAEAALRSLRENRTVTVDEVEKGIAR